MPEVILPCPAWACQGEIVECKQDGENFFIECAECGMRGPVECDPYHAQQSWDWIPRALRWTHEPPKVAGPYYVRQREDKDKPWSNPHIVSIKTLTISRSEYWQFAGPIPPPIE